MMYRSYINVKIDHDLRIKADNLVNSEGLKIRRLNIAPKSQIKTLYLSSFGQNCQRLYLMKSLEDYMGREVT